MPAAVRQEFLRDKGGESDGAGRTDGERPWQMGAQVCRPAHSTHCYAALFSANYRMAVHRSLQRAASAIAVRCVAHCSALRWACDISARFVVPASRLAFALMAGSHEWLQMRWRCFMMRQGSVPGRAELQGGNENGTCQLVMARPMMIGYRGMSIPRWRILVSGSWHRRRGQAAACVR